MKKDNRLAKLGVFALLITLIALILVANTYAKYTTAKDFESSATVAKWSIKLNGKDIIQNEEVTFDLFKTIKDTDNSIETDVTSGKIAPGTQGSFDIKVRNDSEVTAEYEISFTGSNSKRAVFFCTKVCCHENRIVWFPRTGYEHRKKRCRYRNIRWRF